MATSPNSPVTDFSRDVLGRFVCNGFDEMEKASDPNPRPDLGRPEARPDARPFDIIVIGGGTFGAAIAEHLWFRSAGTQHRILVLEAGPFFLPEHVQNLPVLRLDPAGASSIKDLRDANQFGPDKPRNEVWGLPWHSPAKFPGLAYCVGGRSIYWGGWSPELLNTELPPAQWPAQVLAELQSATLPNGLHGYFQQASDQIGVSETNDFIFGELHTALRDQLLKGIGNVTDAVPLGTLPDHPGVRFNSAALSDDDLARMLGLSSPGGRTRQELLDELKLEAPLAVQGRAGHAGFFPFNKFSAVPLLIKAAREAAAQAGGDDVKKPLMVVPKCRVNRLRLTPDGGKQRVDLIETNLGNVRVPPIGKVIIALGTIESARLAKTSFTQIPQAARDRIGTNLMAHLRSNLDIRVPRTAFASLPAAVRALQASALFVKCRHTFTAAEGGGVGHFHFQITASGLGVTGAGSEAELFKKIPDVDQFDAHTKASDSHVVITIRGIGEMEPGNPQSAVELDNETEFGVQRAFVKIMPSPRDLLLWTAMDKASDDIARVFANGHEVDLFIRDRQPKLGVDPANLATELPYRIHNPANPGRRDGIGTTHHEAGPLWMGDNDSTSVTNADGRFHEVTNTYALGPSVFPTIGSPNPMLTGIALARRLADHLIPPPRPLPAPPTHLGEAGFTALFDGTPATAANWRQVGGGSFSANGRALIARPQGEIGLLYYEPERFENFVLRMDVLLPRPVGDGNDNSGVFVRFRDPLEPVPDPANPGVSHPYINQAFVAVHTGFEAQIDDEARGDGAIGEADGHFFNRTGAIYKVKTLGTAPGEQDYTAPTPLTPRQWHSYEIEVDGDDYTVRINGAETTRFTRAASDSFRGKAPSIDPFSGHIGIQTHTGNVAFANIRLKKL